MSSAESESGGLALVLPLVSTLSVSVSTACCNEPGGCGLTSVFVVGATLACINRCAVLMIVVASMDVVGSVLAPPVTLVGGVVVVAVADLSALNVVGGAVVDVIGCEVGAGVVWLDCEMVVTVVDDAVVVVAVGVGCGPGFVASMRLMAGGFHFDARSYVLTVFGCSNVPSSIF